MTDSTHLISFKLSFDLYSKFEGKGEIRWVEKERVILRNGKEIGVFDNNYVERFSTVKGWNNYTFLVSHNLQIKGLRLDPIDKLTEGMVLKNIDFSYFKSKKDSSIYNDYQSIKIETFNDDLISGTIKIKEKGMLFFPILYDDNWKLYIDGIEEKLVRANIGFTGVMIDIGEHEIILKYIPKGIDASLILSSMGLFMLIMFGVVNKKYYGNLK